MTDLRPTTPKWRRGLKAVVRRLLELAGGVTSFEHVTRVKAPALSKYGSPDDETHMPLDVAMDLMRDTGSNGILSYMAAELGYKLVALEADGQGAALPDIANVAAIVQGYSKLFTELSDAVADGVITSEEARNILNEIEPLVQQLRALQRKVQAAVPGGAS